MSQVDLSTEELTRYKTIDFVQSVEDYRFLKSEMDDEAWRFAYESGPKIIEELIDIAHHEERPDKVKPRTLLSNVGNWQEYERGRFDQLINALEEKNALSTDRKGYVELGKTNMRELASYDHSLKAYRLADHTRTNVDAEDTVFALRHHEDPEAVEIYGPTVLGILRNPELEENEVKMAANLAFENAFEEVDTRQTECAIDFFEDLGVFDRAETSEIDEVVNGLEEFYDINL
ncbi:MAG: hypothetical protein H8Z69_02075 [Nanohaloarchaea archaeon]|nr:hypothetical protein [Candidatus Nanohaloarchaea archaeon]